MAEGVTPFYTLSNYGANQNCTLTAFYPAVVAIRAVSIGSDDTLVNYDVGFFYMENKKLKSSKIHYNIIERMFIYF